MKFTKTQIRKIGEKFQDHLIDGDTQEFNDCINEWRRAHQSPLETVYDYIVELSNEIDNSICSSRLKRVSSIKEKLLRKNSNTHLQTMGDIAGCRLIVDNFKEIDYCLRKITEKFDVLNVNYHTEGLQTSGYTGVHVICKFDKTDKLLFNGLKVEIQLRIKHQHTWATTVEILDLICGTRMKTGQIVDGYSEFMKASAILLHYLDTDKNLHQINPPKELLNNIDFLNKKLNIEKKIDAYNDTLFPLALNKPTPGYSIIRVHKGSNYCTIKYFGDKKEEALNKYFELEKDQNTQRDDKYPLLAYCINVENLPEAFPNYFSKFSTSLFDLINNIKS